MRSSRLLCSLTLILTNALNSQWVQDQSITGGVANVLARNGTSIYVGTMKGDLYRSSNEGISWQLVSSTLVDRSLSNFGISSLGVEDSLIISYGGALYRSTDDGLSWQNIGTGLPLNIDINSLVITKRIFFVGSDGKGVYYSTDYGTTWVQRNNGLSGNARGIFKLTTGGGVLYAGTREGIYRSTDKGGNWISSNSGIPLDWFPAIAVAGDTVFAGADGWGVYKSTNRGVSWVSMSSGLMSKNVYTLTLDERRLYAGTLRGLYWCDLNDTVWFSTDTSINTMRFNDLISSNGSVIAATWGGIYRTDSNPITWIQSNNGIRNVDVRALFKKANVVLCGTSGSGVYQSNDEGATWSAFNTGLAGKGLFVNAIETLYDTVVIGTGDSFSEGEVYWFDSNKNIWVKTAYQGATVRSLVSSGNVLLAGTYGDGIYRTTDFGKTWTNTSSGLATGYVYSFLNVRDTIFAGIHSYSDIAAGLFKSVNGGLSWTPSNSGLSKYLSIRALARKTNTLFCAADKVYKSDDSGSSWTATGTMNTGLRVYGLGVKDSILLAAADNGVFVSLDDGATWSQMDRGMEGIRTAAVAVAGNYVLAGTFANSLWRRPLGELLSVHGEGVGEIPATFALSQNYPNPFNPSTTILYELPDREKVTLRVYDLLGREVKTLVDSYKPPGKYEVTFSAAQLSSGVYFYTMQAGNFVKTKKLVVVK